MSDLNIIQRGINSNSWTPDGGKIDAASLHKIVEQRTDNSSALNALPTPFARFFVANEAFRRLYEQRNNAKSSPAGYAYERLVSDCLDVYEVLFNKGYHDTCGDKIVIKEWLLEENMPRLKETVQILHDAVNTYIHNDLGDIDRLYFIILVSGGKEYLLGTSSSLTGFVTPPDLDKKMKDDVPFKLKRKGNRNSGYYFRDVRLLEERSPEFKNYMYNILFSKIVDEKFSYIRDYVRTFSTDKEIKNDFQLEISPCKTEDHGELIVNGLQFYSSKEIGNYFADFIIKVPFKISRDNYKLPIIDSRDECDYLLPFSEEAISRLDFKNIDISIRERTSSISVTIKVNGKEEKKEYKKDNTEDNKGRIIDLSESKVTFDLALFPNIRSTVKEENNYYKLMIVNRDNSTIPAVSVNDITCEFYENGNKIDEAIDDNYKYGVKLPIVRSLQEGSSLCGTKFYELFNASFDLIRLSIVIAGETYSGVLIPKWSETSNNRKSYIYAVDLGTTNTFISRRENSSDILRPEQLKMDNPVMSYLHDKDKMKQKDEIDLWEDATPNGFSDYFQTEFIPPFIDGKRYKYPIRTVISKAVNQVGDACLFNNRNIAFSYAKCKIVGQNEVITDIKWNEEYAKTEVSLFIKELLMIIKYDMLQENADLKSTQLIWFRPLSLKSSIQKLFSEIWKKQSQNILGIESSQLKCYTESEAPYYYFSKRDLFKSISSVVVIDIGGGSTDMVYFEKEEPKIANSVHFGCDVLWGNGHNGIKDAKDNGIFNRFKDSIRFDSYKDLAAVYTDMLDPKNNYTTKDIINFWLMNKEITGLTKMLQDNYTYLFLYHYAAIIFYLAKMLKSKKLLCPRAIVFSGNGSRYIDNFLIDDTLLLAELTMVILEGEFPNAEPVQLILEDKRKESTCYGGLYRPSTAKTADPYTFMGVDEKQYKDVGELEEAFNKGLCEQLKTQIDSLNDYYLQMLNLIIRKQKMDGIPVDKIREVINAGILDNLHTDFTKEVIQKYDKSMPMDDSLFFLPIIDLIYNLTKIKK